jgi:hypothetical protein
LLNDQEALYWTRIDIAGDRLYGTAEGGLAEHVTAPALGQLRGRLVDPQVSDVATASTLRLSFDTDCEHEQHFTFR